MTAAVGDTGPAPTMVKAELVKLAAGMTAADAFRHIAQSCVRQFRLNEALLLAGRDAGALHQVRVALRRLRSAFSIFKPVIGSNAHTPLPAAQLGRPSCSEAVCPYV